MDERRRLKVVIAGGSGFLGGHLERAFLNQGNDVVILTRTPRRSNHVEWDGVQQGAWTGALEGADVVINLSGTPVTVRKTDAAWEQIRASRVDSTTALGVAMLACEVPPRSWINASAAGYYGDRGDVLLVESSPAGSNRLAAITQAWEAAAHAFALPVTQRSTVRVGIVLGRDGGVFPRLKWAVRRFVGGALGDGRQWVPWIHIDDLVAIFVWLTQTSTVTVVNASAPEPVRNAELMAALRRRYGRPWVPPLPRTVAALASNLSPVDISLALDSARVIPQALLGAGFSFRYPSLELALDDLMGPMSPP